MLTNKKRVFWEAFLLTTVIFILGILLGVAFESRRSSNLEDYYTQSEIVSTDLFVLNNLVDLDSSNCEDLIQASFDFANRIYSEALLLEKYEDSGKITEKIRLTHRKYDLLRTFLWINAEKTKNKCGEDFDTVIYLYEYNPKNLVQKANQNVWSKVLGDLKEAKGDSVLLIPIAINSDLISLQAKINSLNITKYPAVVINDKDILLGIDSVSDLESYLI